MLERMTEARVVTLNRAVAVAMASGPATASASHDGLGERLGDHHSLHSVRPHLLGQAGDRNRHLLTSGPWCPPARRT